MATSFTNTQLFGGAITANIPSGFADVSTIRQIPDNQEVYLDTDGFTSLTFDITERVAHLSNDREALEYHFADIIADEDTREVLSVDEDMRLPNFSRATPILSLLAKATPPPNSNPRPLTPTFTTIYLSLIRLVEQKTDIIISLNIPNILGQTDTQSRLASDGQPNGEQVAVKVWREILTTFKIKDWDLFVVEE